MRYVVDTNLISELRHGVPHPGVVRWWAAQDADDLLLTATVAGELLLGVELLPPGRKREALSAWVRTVIESTFAGRILPFDLDAARVFARIVGEARRAGVNVGAADAEIAAVALSQGLTVATRNVRDFGSLGVPLVDPWTDPAGV